MATEFKIMLNDVRCRFLTLGEPRDYKDNKRFRWSATVLIPYESAYKKQIDELMMACSKEKWGAKWKANYENAISDPKGCCFTDGKRKMADYPEFEGHFALAAHRPLTKGRPLVFDKDKSPIYKADGTPYDGKAGKIYDGMRINMQFRIYAMDPPTMGLFAELLGVQAFRDSDAFGAGAPPRADDFAEIADGADADDLA